MSIAFALLLVVLVGAFLLRVPLAYAMISAGIVYMAVSGADLGNAAQLMMSGYYSKFVLIAVPLFIFGAQVMNDSTVTDRIFSFADAVVGRVHGGLAQVNVVNSVIISGMSGSAIADASGAGIMEIKSMRDAGYPRGFACATTAATATIGPIIPPSIPMVIYAYLSGASIGMLFAGGFIPGFLLAVMQMILIFFTARRRAFPRGEWPGVTALIARFLSALPALLVPVLLLGGIYSGVFTPTEAAAVASLYALLLAFVAYRAMSLQQFRKTLVLVTRQTAVVSLIIGGSLIINYAVASEGLPQRAAEGLLSLSGNGLVLLLLINVVFLFAGMFLDTMVMLLIMIPIVLPVLAPAGIDPVHFGVVITLNMMIGLSTPPFGVLLFVVSSMTNTPLAEVIREIWPYLGIMIVTLVLLVLIPDLVLVVPRALGYGR